MCLRRFRKIDISKANFGSYSLPDHSSFPDFELSVDAKSNGIVKISWIGSWMYVDEDSFVYQILNVFFSLGGKNVCSYRHMIRSDANFHFELCFGCEWAGIVGVVSPSAPCTGSRRE